MVRMVFENLTLFEVSLDGAQIGPRSIGRESSADDAPVEASPGAGPGRFAPLVVLALVVGLAALYRRSQRSDVDLAAVDDEEAELAEAR